MERSRISSFRSKVWAKVSFETVKSTEIWKKHADSNGYVPKKNMKTILTAALVELGYDDKSNIRYERSPKVMIRSSDNQVKGNMTFIYSFPVLRGHSLEKFYMVSGLVHFNPERKAKEHDLSEYGLEAYETFPKKQNKLDDQDLDIPQVIGEEGNFDHAVL